MEKAWYGEQQAKKRRKIPRKKEKLKTPEIRRKVIELLVQEQSSPRDISWRLEEEELRISWRAIYYFTKHDHTELQQQGQRPEDFTDHPCRETDDSEVEKPLGDERPSRFVEERLLCHGTL